MACINENIRDSSNKIDVTVAELRIVGEKLERSAACNQEEHKLQWSHHFSPQEVLSNAYFLAV